MRTAFSAGLRSPRTTTLGIVAGSLVILHALQDYMDGDPSTVPDWSAVVEILIGLSAMLAGIFGRDAVVTSQQSLSKSVVGWFLVLTLGSAAVLSAAEPTLLITSTGRYYLLTEDGSGGLVATELTQIVRLAPKPTDPTDPNPDPPQGIAEKMTATSLALLPQVDDPEKAKTQRAIAAIYRQVSDLIGSGIQTPDQVRIATDSLYNAALRAVGRLDAWSSWKAAIDDVASSAAGGDVEQWRVAWQAVAESLGG